MGKPVALVTGAGGEMGTLLLPALDERGVEVVALDLHPLSDSLRSVCRESVELDLLEVKALAALIERHRPSQIFHLAAILSNSAERDWQRAHRINVGTTLELFRLARELGADPVRFLFPSSIAVYGLPDRQTKDEAGAVKEWQWTSPTGIYGCNKLYCETVGTYLSDRVSDNGLPPLDFRAIRFPGLISADTLPSGGTTDYAPEMIHAAAQRKPYRAFVRESSRLPFMTMPDAVSALLDLAATETRLLSRRVFNIRGFSSSAGEIRKEVLRHFPDAQIDFEPDFVRQAFVDSWPGDVDDSPARREWGFSPRHGLIEAFGDYLIPALERRYGSRDRGVRS